MILSRYWLAQSSSHSFICHLSFQRSIDFVVISAPALDGQFIIVVIKSHIHNWIYIKKKEITFLFYFCFFGLVVWLLLWCVVSCWLRDASGDVPLACKLRGFFLGCCSLRVVMGVVSLGGMAWCAKDGATDDFLGREGLQMCDRACCCIYSSMNS